MNIKIKYKYNCLPIVKKGDWIDLRSYETIHYKKGDVFIIDLGVAMELPKGYEALVAPRSSTFKKYGLIMTNSLGVIDNDYNGDEDYWGFPVIAMKDGVIHKDDRVAQFRIIENMASVDFVEVNQLENKNRGGFGSTGSK